jgi:hypothetical protein
MTEHDRWKTGNYGNEHQANAISDMPDCEVCGCGADCHYGGSWLCDEHVESMFSDAIRLKCDPLEENYNITVLVHADKTDMSLSELQMMWTDFDGGRHEAYYSIEDIERINNRILAEINEN